jgi:hypothetical protein
MRNSKCGSFAFRIPHFAFPPRFHSGTPESRKRTLDYRAFQMSPEPFRLFTPSPMWHADW